MVKISRRIQICKGQAKKLLVYAGNEGAMNRKSVSNEGYQSFEDFNKMESYLNRTLEPINPRREFVDKLRGQLVDQKQSASNTFGTLEYLILAVIGLISSIILLVTSIRAAMAIFEAIRYLRQNRNNVDPSKTLPVLKY